jgi:hypothetical protein
MIIANTLRINKATPTILRFISDILMINNTGMMRLLEKILNEMAAMEERSILLLWKSILSSVIFVSLFVNSFFSSSITSIRDRSMVLPSLLVSESRMSPTPDIKATGVMHDCKNCVNDCMDSI